LNNNESPLITVYITNYNYGKFLRKAIDSVLNQSFTDFELLIIDDGSTDNSISIIEEYQNNSKIKIIYQKNKGLVVTNNIALRIANGKFIIRLDADDYFDHNAFLVLYNKIVSDDSIGLVYPDYFVVDEDDNILFIRQREDIENIELKDHPAHGACTLVRTDFLKQIGGYDEDFNCQDGYHLWLHFVSKFKVANISTPLFYYRRHNSNLTNNSDKIYRTRAAIKTKYFDQNFLMQDKIFAVIPIRGSNKIALNKIGTKSIVERKIDVLSNTELVEMIIVSTPDESLLDFLQKKYSENKKLLLHKRDIKLTMVNSGLVETIHSILEKFEFLKSYKAFLTADIKYPFLNSDSVNTAIKTLFIFNSNSLLTVRPDNSRYFVKDSYGLTPIPNQEKYSKLERDDLYRYAGGIIITTMELFLNQDAFVNKKTGHFIIDEFSSFAIESETDIKIAELINNEFLK